MIREEDAPSSYKYDNFAMEIVDTEGKYENLETEELETEIKRRSADISNNRSFENSGKMTVNQESINKSNLQTPAKRSQANPNEENR